MTTIERLGIRGIRSYDQDDETIVRFYKPLTIFCGHNGSGKSTVIEAVKMAITGDLPPMVDKGSAFLNDPRIHSNTETHAKIRLKFFDVNGLAFLVNRQFVLTNKSEKKQEFKTTEQTLQKTLPDGTKTSLSLRVSDVNRIIPEIMNVSRPVLNNVIFVHQEESLWPLGDPKKLKEKFDDIFAATRYTKALEVIRKYRKEQAIQLRLLRKDMQLFEEKVKALDKMKIEHDTLKEKETDLRNAVRLLTVDLERVNSRMEHVKDLKSTYMKQFERRTSLKSEEKVFEKERERVLDVISENLSHLGLAEITSQKDEVRSEVNNLQSSREERNRKLETARSEREVYSKSRTKKLVEMGELESETKSQDDRLREIAKIKKGCQSDFFNEHVTRPSDNADIDMWTKAFRELVYNAETSLDDLKKKCRANEEAALGALGEASQSLKAAQNEAERLKNASSESRKEAQRLTARVLQLTKELAGLDSEGLKARQADLKRQIDDLHKLGTIDKASARISNLRNEQDKVNRSLDDLISTRDALRNQEVQQSRLNVLRDQLALKRKVLNTTIAVFAQEVVAYAEEPFSLDLPPDALRKQAESTLDSLSASVVVAEKTVNAKIASCNDECKAAEVTQSHWQKRLGEARTSLNSIHSSLESFIAQLSSDAGLAFSSNDIPEVRVIDKLMEKTGSELQKASSTRACIDMVREMREKDKQFIKEESRCPTCSHECKSESRKAKIIEYLDNKVKREVHDIKKAQQSKKKKQLQADLERLRSIREEIVKHEKVSSSVSEMERSLAEIEQNLKAKRSELAKATKESEDTEGRARELDRPREVMEDLRRLDEGIEDAEKEKKHEESIFGAGAADPEQLKTIESKIKELRKKGKAIRKEMDVLQNEKDTAEEKLAELRRLFDNVTKTLLVNIGKDSEITELRNQAKKLQEAAREADENFRDLMGHKVPEKNKVFSSMECELAAVRAENEHHVQNFQNTLRKKQKVSDNWEAVIRGVQAFVRSGKAESRKRLGAEIDKLDKKLEDLREDIDAWNKEAEIDADAAKSANERMANLENNILFKEYTKRLEELRIEIRGCDRDMEKFSKEAGGDIDKELESLDRQKQEVVGNRSATRGRQAVTKQALDQKAKELRLAEREGSRDRFDEARIKEQTMRLAYADLERYHRALDQALMAFHHLKMSSINKTIKELWQRTYSGSDIDSIAIMSDADTGMQSTTVRRNYNYRVVMKRGDALLDMRGRCSAGQKVLACLVIRLALADSFCSDCGILALDEPTTNLDEANIESLADALSKLIDTRKSQRNFQLILITHDRQFIDQIGARSFCNEYYNVHKDPNGFSKIKAQSILGIE